MDQEREPGLLRIGELSKRLGVSEHLLRAWETRYGLLNPARSEGGYRLYTQADQFRVRRMQAYLSEGLAASEAARAAIAEEKFGALGGFTELPQKIELKDAIELLGEKLEGLDESAAQAVFDRLFADYTVESVLRDVLLPYLRDVGRRWARGHLSVGQEHFASNVIHGRLFELARGWGSGSGPQAILACLPGEEHEFGLLISGIVLHRRGWSIRYLGVNTPMHDILELTSETRPALVLVTAMVPDRFTAVIPELVKLSQRAPLVIGGKGASKALARKCGAQIFPGDAVTAAHDLAEEMK